MSVVKEFAIDRYDFKIILSSVCLHFLLGNVVKVSGVAELQTVTVAGTSLTGNGSPYCLYFVNACINIRRPEIITL